MTAPSRPPAAAAERAEAETRGSETRERLLLSAVEVIGKGGWGAASVAAIAERAGVAAGTLYRHFESKADLFAEVIRSISEREADAMYLAAGKESGFSARFDAVVATYAGRALRNRPLAWALVYEPVDPLVDAERLAYRRIYSRYMARLLKEGVDLGALPPQDTDLAAAAVVGVIHETLIGPLSPVAHETAPQQEIVRAIVRLCRRVIGSEAPAA